MEKYITIRNRSETVSGNVGSELVINTESSADRSDKKISNTYLFNGVFFKEPKLLENGRLKAQCSNCSKIISGSEQSTGNFLSHIKRLHPGLTTKLVEVRAEAKKKCLAPNLSARHYTQTTLFSACTPINKEKVLKLVFNYIAAEMRPLSSVEKPRFIELLEGLTNKKNITPDRRALTRELHVQYNCHKQTLINTLKNQAYICATADLWSSNNRSYLGMTVHYIVESTYERKSNMLCCKRFYGRHTYSKIGLGITNVFKDFEIDISKITHIITDNASNFAKAFNIFGNSSNEENVLTASEREQPNESNVDCGSAVPDAEVTIADLDPILGRKEQHGNAYGSVDAAMDVDDEEEIILPNHMRCVAHTLNLVATTDASKALSSNAEYKKVFRSTFGKLQAFWNLISRSTVASDLTFEVCQCKFPVPVLTRWHSYYDATKKILDHKTEIGDLFLKLKLAKLKNVEWQFIAEYCNVMYPLAHSIDILQGENQCCLGYVAPTIHTLRSRLLSLGNDSLKLCSPLRTTIVLAIERRFKHIFDIENIAESKAFILSAISHPKFKTKWIPDRHIKYCKNLFANECKLLNNVPKPIESESEDSDDFFSSFSHKSATATVDSPVFNDNDFELYLKSKRKDLNMLDSFSTIKAIFLKYNTSLPSSAPVERIFSSGSLIMTPRRNRLSDEHFEMLLACRSNLK